MRIILDPPILAVIYGISTEISRISTKISRITTEISGFRERFQISREISGEVYEISVSGGPLVRKYIPPPCCSRPDPAYIPLAAAHLPFATSCPAQRGKADVQSGLPAGAASLRETGSVDRYTPRGPVSHGIV